MKLDRKKMEHDYSEMIDKIQPIVTNRGYDIPTVYIVFSVLAEMYRELFRDEVKNKDEFDTYISAFDIICKDLISKGIRQISEQDK